MESYMVCSFNKNTRKTKVLYYNLRLCVVKSIVRHMNKTDKSSIYWGEVEPKRYW